MKTKTLKELRISAEEMNAEDITNQEALLAALPVLIELQNAVNYHRKAVNTAASVVKALSARCTAYAVKHQSVFDAKKLIPNQQEVLTGDITIENFVYHLACGYDGYQRTDPKIKMTQGFLESLPDAWRKTTVELDVSGINQAHPTDEELDGYGLCQKPNNVWSGTVHDTIE